MSKCLNVTFTLFWDILWRTGKVMYLVRTKWNLI